MTQIHYLSPDYVDGMITGGLITFGIVVIGIAITLAWILLMRCMHGAKAIMQDTCTELDCMTCMSVQCENCPFTTSSEQK